MFGDGCIVEEKTKETNIHAIANWKSFNTFIIS